MPPTPLAPHWPAVLVPAPFGPRTLFARPPSPLRRFDRVILLAIMLNCICLGMDDVHVREGSDKWLFLQWADIFFTW